MNEKLSKKTPENKPEAHSEQHEKIESPEATAESPKETAEKVAKIRESVKDRSEKSQEMLKKIHEQDVENKEDTLTYTNGALRKTSFNNTMRSVRRNLGPVDKTLSKVIHNPVVFQVSEVAGKTVGRPSGIIGGSLAAIVTSVVILIMAKKSGFEIRPVMFLLLFAAGFAIGIAVEAMFKAGKRLQR